jgi:hypothetical protein
MITTDGSTAYSLGVSTEMVWWVRTDRLLREDSPLISDLLRVLAGDCPELNSTNISDRCDVRCSTLAELPAQQGQ